MRNDRREWLTQSATTDCSTVAYFNNAGQARLSARVERIGCDCLRRPPYCLSHDTHDHDDGDLDQSHNHNNVEEGEAILGGEDDHDTVTRIRELFAQLIGARSCDIALVHSTSYAISLAAYNLERSMPEGGQILLLQDQFPSAVYPWQELCTRSKGLWTLHVVPYPETCWTEQILIALHESHERHTKTGREPRIRVACLPPLHWSDGALVDLEIIQEVCRKYEISLIVDATQAIGAMELSLPKHDALAHQSPVLLVTCSVHKWLRAPSGVALVYLHPSVHDLWHPLDHHARSRQASGRPDWDANRNQMTPDGYPRDFWTDARKFDTGGKPHPILLPMLCAALEEVVALDMKQVQNRLCELMSPVLDWATTHGYELPPGPHAYHIIGIRPHPPRNTEELLAMARLLASQYKIIIAVRCGKFRISPYLDTTPTEVERLITALSELTVPAGMVDKM